MALKKIKVVGQLRSETCWLYLYKPYCILLVLKKEKALHSVRTPSELWVKKGRIGVFKQMYAEGKKKLKSFMQAEFYKQCKEITFWKRMSISSC